MTTHEPTTTFKKRSKYMSDVLGYFVAAAYSGSALLFFLFNYHLAGCVYLITTVYLIGMSVILIFQMFNIDSASERLKNALYEAVPEALKIDFSFCFYHALLMSGIVLPFLMDNASQLTQTTAILVGFMEILMLGIAKTLHNRIKKEQP